MSPDQQYDDLEKKLQCFLVLYNANHQRMYLFAKSLLPMEEHVKDILQEVSLALWKKFDHFEFGTDFLSWAFRMIRIEVLEWRRKQSRERMLFDDEFLETVADRMSQQSQTTNDGRYHALLECVKKLTPKMRELLRSRYFKNHDASTIASESNRSIESVYQQLYRMRTSLQDCVSRKLKLVE